MRPRRVRRRGRTRENARAAGEPFPKIGELSTRLVTQAKTTPKRSWLGEVSAVVLQQSLRDAETAYRNFFASLGASVCGAPVRPGAIPAQREETGSHGVPTGNRAA
ncbi:hypothetical protein ACFW5S_03205 [Streptomyces olivaceus]|uniref:hypothetical protein n=1 Tax=Streptomyces olivaceus TaxID=47716 RepID=UPI0036B92B02